MSAAKKIILLLWLVLVASLGNASALTPGATETCIWEKSAAAIETHPANPLETADRHQENGNATYGFASASLLAAEETRALTLPATDASLAGTTTLGYTTPSGDIFLQPGLSRAEQLSTLQHESVHAFFSPSGDGALATFRQNLGQWGYDNSQLLRYSEEAMAETYGSGSLLQGLRHPLVNGYGITPGGLLLEGGVVGGGLFGAGYLGYQMGGGGH